MLFKDRGEAGQKLAELLKEFLTFNNTLVAALPRGGVPVGFEIAKTLNVKFTILPVRKLGLPSNPELAFGAIDPDGSIYLNPQVVQTYNLPQEVIEEVAKKELQELKRRLDLYLEGKIPNFENREVVIVDDGFATGFTALAACGFVKKRNPQELILSAPVAPPDTVEFLKANCNTPIVVYKTPEPFFAVGMFYEDFHQLSDAEVLKYREMAKQLGLWEP